MRLFSFGFLFAIVAAAQSSVPKFVRFNGTSQHASSTEGVTLAVYGEQFGGAALWQEVQNVDVDAEGRYSLLMGSTLNDGMPMELFRSGEPRWLGVQFNRPGEIEQPRVLLVSVPYALKASDADTLGGKPASAYLLAEASTAPATAAAAPTSPPITSSTTAPPNSVKPRLNAGSPNFLAKFADSTNLINSVMFENGGLIGVGTAQPLIGFDVRAGQFPQLGAAQTTDYLSFFASDQFGPAIYWDPGKDLRFGKGGASLYNPFGFTEQMRIQSSTGNVGIGTQSPGSKLDVAGDINFTGVVRFQGVPVLQMPAIPGDAFPSDSGLALGVNALANNTTGSFSTAIGTGALLNNTSGSSDTAVGFRTLIGNTTGEGNTAVGDGSLSFNTTGNNNTALGSGALSGNTTGHNNISIGALSAFFVSGNGSSNIHIGTRGMAGDNNTIRIGDPAIQTLFYAAGVRGITTTNNDAIPVMIDSAGQLGTVSSSRRFKEDIHDMGDASSDLMRLRPVTYRYKQPFADGSKPVQYGLIAEEVAEVYPDLVAHSADGQIETVKYQVLDSMLLNEVQRLQAEIKKLEERLAKVEGKP